ncbi:MAG: DNA-binding helix-turn-helix protein [Parcubacteria group bacterium GW2011_GWA2_47_64]|nr:MAG: DNA-binding helix-turn-helix protein [Parcubacteria group bacterium GW2011_GWA2_47_64]KKU95686.1 MAG: DNA-binding helix-turn-helix protein [Parcubacteria group bacterium GW2011_GWC2_48_17]
MKMITHKKFKAELLRDPNVRKAYEELKFEFEIIKAIIRVRAQKKLTQRQLAQKIGVAQSALARFESGRVNPTLSFLKKVTHGLGLTLTVK